MNQSKEWCFLESICWSPSMFWMQVVYCKYPEGTFLEMSREFIEMLSCVPLQSRSRDTCVRFILALWSVTLYIQTYICCNGRVKLDNRRHIHIFSSCYTTFSMVLLNWEKTLFLAVLLLAFFDFFDFFFFCFLRSFFCLSLSAFFRAFCCFRHCLNWPFIFVCSCRKLSICLRVVSTTWRLRTSLSELHFRRSLSKVLFSLRIFFLTDFICWQLGRKLRLHCQK